eukprot:scaffold2.g7004.t1
MTGKTKLVITLGKLTGHGLHSVLPSEQVYAQVVLEKEKGRLVETRLTEAHKAADIAWAPLAFEYEGGMPAALRVSVHGRLPNGADDLLGAGELSLPEVLEPAKASRAAASVPLVKSDRHMGEVEVVVESTPLAR